MQMQNYKWQTSCQRLEPSEHSEQWTVLKCCKHFAANLAYVTGHQHYQEFSDKISNCLIARTFWSKRRTRVWGDSVMKSPQMMTQANFSCNLPAANVAVVSGTISVMNSFQMQIQAVWSREFPAANLALVSRTTRTMNTPQMLNQVTLAFKLPAANLALVTWTTRTMNSSQM